jgi:hypothetical protein
MAGQDLTTVKELLGHKDIKMTLRRAHLAPSHIMKTVDILDNAFTPAPTSQKLHNSQVVEKFDLQKPLQNMVGARGVEPLTSTVSGHFRGNVMFPLFFFLATLVYVLQDRVRALFPDISGFDRMLTIRKLYTQRPLPKLR